MIMAGVGTGKTHTLMTKFSYLMMEMKVSHHNIMAVTFTNKAAKEMRERAELAYGKKLDSPWIGTFHSLSLKMFRNYHNYEKVGIRHDFHILDEKDSRK